MSGLYDSAMCQLQLPEMSGSGDSSCADLETRKGRPTSSDSSDEIADTHKMADISSGKTRPDGAQGTGFSPGRPLSMKIFASWEVDTNSSSCIPRLFYVKLTRLQILKKMETNLSDVVISVSMQGSRRVLRSNEINLPQSGLIDTDVDLSFSLQYPHFLKRHRNNVQIMIQRRKRYKTRAILGYKTLAVGLVNLSEVLQYPVSTKRCLPMYTKGDPTILAKVTMTNLTSQPVENDLDREIPQQNADDRAEEDNSSEDDDDYYSTEGSDSGGEMEAAQDILGGERKGRKVKFKRNQIKFKKRIITLLKKFRVPEEEVFGTLEESPREPEGVDDFSEDFDDFDSDSDPEHGDNTSIKSQDKPKLRPYFDRAASVDSMYVERKQKSEKSTKTIKFDSDESTDIEHQIVKPHRAHSDSEQNSDAAVYSDSQLSHPHIKRISDNDNKTRRSLSVKEGKQKHKKLERRNSDQEIQQIATSTIHKKLSVCFPNEDQIPPSIFLVNTSEWQGQLLALKLQGKQPRMVSTNSTSEVQEVITAILAKYQKFCHTHSHSPPCLKVAMAGTEGYISVVLRSYTEQFSSKPLWQTYLRFLVIPLDCNHAVAKYISSIDSTYNSLFMDNFWREIFEKSDSKADFDTVNERISSYLNGATLTNHLPIAEVLINRQGFDDDSSRFVPFIGGVRIGCMDLGETDDAFNGNSQVPNTSQITTTTSLSQPSTSPPTMSQVVETKPGPSVISKDNTSSPAVVNELMDLQVDYWTSGGKKDSNKSTLKTSFKSLMVNRQHNTEEPNTLQMIATTKESNLRKVHKSAFEAMMRGKKSKERESETRGTIIANVTKLVCTSKSQNNSLNVVIDGVSWDGVKFFSLSPQWSRHVKTFPIGVFGPVETSF